MVVKCEISRCVHNVDGNCRKDTISLSWDNFKMFCSEIEVEEIRPCTCGSGIHWARCTAGSPYCG